MINQAIKNGVWPDFLKLEVVTPIPKIKSLKSVEDLRKISGLIEGNNKVSVQLEIFFAGIPQGPLETSPGTIGIIQKRFQGPPARGF